MVEVGDGVDYVLQKYVFNEGKNVGIKKPESIGEAYGLVKTCALDSFSTKDEISLQNEKAMVWNKKSVAFPLYWTIVMASLMAGIFESSPVEFSVSENLEFCLKLKS